MEAVVGAQRGNGDMTKIGVRDVREGFEGIETVVGSQNVQLDHVAQCAQRVTAIVVRLQDAGVWQLILGKAIDFGHRAWVIIRPFALEVLGKVRQWCGFGRE